MKIQLAVHYPNGVDKAESGAYVQSIAKWKVFYF